MSATVADRVKKIAADVRKLVKRVDDYVAPVADPTKRVQVQVTQAVSFLTGDFSQKTAAFVNGGDDIYLMRLGCSVQMVRPAPDPAPVMPPGVEPPFPYVGMMLDLPSGFYARSSDGTGRVSPVPLFDFRWNYQVTSTQAAYNSSANNVALLSRQSLGNQSTLEGLTFDPPGQLLKAGDTIVFFVEPTLYPFPGMDPAEAAPWNWDYSNTSFVVNMLAVGYRDGRMAEAAYER